MQLLLKNYNFLQNKKTFFMFFLGKKHLVPDLSLRQECNYCSKPVVLYEIHCKDMHMDIVEKDWFKCLECDEYYETSLKLHKHIHRKHKGRENKVNLVFDITYCTFNVAHLT